MDEKSQTKRGQIDFEQVQKQLNQLREWACTLGGLSSDALHDSDLIPSIISTVDKYRNNISSVSQANEKVQVAERLSMARTKELMAEQIAQLNATVGNLRVEIVETEQKGDKRTQAARQELEKANAVIAIEQQKRVEQEMSEMKLKNELNEQNERLKQQKLQNSQLLANIMELKKEQDALKEQLDGNDTDKNSLFEKMKIVQREKNEILVKYNEATSAIETIQAERQKDALDIQNMKRILVTNAKEKEELRAEMERCIDEERQRGLRALSELRGKGAADLEEAREMSSNSEKQREQFEKNFKDRQRKDRENQLKELQQVREEHERDIANYKKDFEAKIESLQSNHKEQLEKLIQLSEKLKQEKQDAINKGKEQQNKLEMQIKELNFEFSKNMDDLKEQLRIAKNACKEKELELMEFQRKMKEEQQLLEASQKTALLEGSKELERREQELMGLLQQAKNENNQLRQNLQTTERESQQKIKELEHQLERISRENQDNLRKEGLRLNALHQQQLNELEMNNKQAIQLSNHNHALQLQKLQAECADSIENAKKDSERKFQGIIASEVKKQDALKDQIAELQKQLLDVQKELEQTRSNTDNLVLGSKEQDQLLKSLLADKQLQIDRLQQELFSANNKYLSLQGATENQINQMKNSHTAEQARLKREFDSELQENLKKQLEFTEKYQKEFMHLKQISEAKLKELKGKIFYLEQLLAIRPSRSDDMEQINNLIKQVEHKKQETIKYSMQLNQANGIVKYLQLQLENYKANYDMFGPGGNGSSNKQTDGQNAVQLDSSLSPQIKKPSNRFSIIPFQLNDTNEIINAANSLCFNNGNVPLLLPAENSLTLQSSKESNNQQSISSYQQQQQLQQFEQLPPPSPQRSQQLIKSVNSKISLLPWEQQLQLSLQQQQQQQLLQKKMQLIHLKKTRFQRAESFSSSNEILENAENFLENLLEPVSPLKIPNNKGNNMSICSNISGNNSKESPKITGRLSPIKPPQQILQKVQLQLQYEPKQQLPSPRLAGSINGRSSQIAQRKRKQSAEGNSSNNNNSSSIRQQSGGNNNRGSSFIVDPQQQQYQGFNFNSEISGRIKRKQDKNKVPNDSTSPALSIQSFLESNSSNSNPSQNLVRKSLEVNKSIHLPELIKKNSGQTSTTVQGIQQLQQLQERVASQNNQQGKKQKVTGIMKTMRRRLSDSTPRPNISGEEQEEFSSNFQAIQKNDVGRHSIPQSSMKTTSQQGDNGNAKLPSLDDNASSSKNNNNNHKYDSNRISPRTTASTNLKNE